MKSVTNRYKPPIIRNRIEDLNRFKGQMAAMKSKSMSQQQIKSRSTPLRGKPAG